MCAHGVCRGTCVWRLKDDLMGQSCFLFFHFETGSLLFVAVCAVLASPKTSVKFCLHSLPRGGTLGFNMHTAVSGFKGAPDS